MTLLVIDLTITLFNLPLSGPNAFFLAAFSLIITSLVMHYIETGLDHKYQLQIISKDRTAGIQQMLLDNQKSLTVYHVEGDYS